jgi:hypothetical protein
MIIYLEARGRILIRDPVEIEERGGQVEQGRGGPGVEWAIRQ